MKLPDHFPVSSDHSPGQTLLQVLAGVHLQQGGDGLQDILVDDVGPLVLLAVEGEVPKVKDRRENSPDCVGGFLRKAEPLECGADLGVVCSSG